MTKKEIFWKKIKFFYNILNKKQRWYTGLAIKKMLRQKVFSLLDGFNNPAITAGRWSAYCHYSQILAFNNLIYKFNLKENAVILVHPLLPAPLVDQLLAFKFKIVSVDLDKSSLAFDGKKLAEYIRQLRVRNEQPELIIHYGFNGIYEPIVELAEEAYRYTIPSMAVIDNPNVNLALLEVFNKLPLGGVVWNFGDSFFDEHLNKITNSNLQSKDWYVSWYLETRTKSILEYHLSKSHTIYQTLIEAVFLITLEDYKKYDWKAGVYIFLAQRYFFESKLKSKKEAQEWIKNNYTEIFNAAVPDVVFDLQLYFPEEYNADYLKQLNNAVHLREQSKKLYNFFLEKLPYRPQGSLEIPDFYLDRTYLKYFVFTTDFKYWNEAIDMMDCKLENSLEIHPNFWRKPGLTQANFITKFLIDVDLCNNSLKIN